MKLVPFILLMVFLLGSDCVTEERYRRDDEGADMYNKCYDEIGCIETDSRWYDSNLRPVNLKPLDRHIIKTDFLLLKTNKSESGGLLYNTMMAKHDSVISAGFSKDAEIIILIHDFTGNGYTGWIKHLGTVLLRKLKSVNVISVDWQRGAEPPYDQAISNARVVALEVMALLKELKGSLDVQLCKIHIVGHGVGAHIAGYVGTKYNSIKKITGLDPSGPRFEGMPDIVKLNPACARYVEVIHTDAYDDSRSQGIKEALGHSDFYINDANLQPGCSENSTYDDVTAVARDTLNEGEILPGCSHKRSFKYFIEAISDTHCVFLGLKCGSYDNFEKGGCTTCNKSDGSCRTFGLKSYKGSVQKTAFFLNTADHHPYCMFEYRIAVFVEKESKVRKGYFDFILIDDKANIAEATLADSVSNYREILGGTKNTYIYYAHPPKIGRIKEVKIRWNEEKKFYCVIYCKQVIKVNKITVKYLGTGRNDEGHEKDMCSVDGGTDIESGAYRTFVRCKKPSHHSKPSKRKIHHPTEVSTVKPKA